MSHADHVAQVREQNRLRANEFRFAYADFKKAMKAGTEDLGIYLNIHPPEEWFARKSVYEILGYAFIGAGRRGQAAGRSALELAAAMPFSVTHWTLVGHLEPAQREWLLRSFYAEVGTVGPAGRVRDAEAASASL